MTQQAGSWPNSPADQPRDSEGPVFSAPWEAQVFATTVQLHRRGLFTWPEWTQALSERIAAARAAGEADLGNTYYHYWFDALEQILAAKGVSSVEELGRYRQAWEQAAHRTPHGQQIELQAKDFDNKRHRLR